jgi:hypothetical protein
MNPENQHPQPHPENGDERKLGHVLQLFDAIEKLGLDTKSPEVKARCNQGINRYGTAFVAYLSHNYLNAEDPDILQRFAVDYVATYPSRTAAIEAFVSEMGWATDREEFGQLHPEAELYLTWDASEIEVRMRELYIVLELNGQTCLFLR